VSAVTARRGTRLGAEAVRFWFDGREFRGFAGDTAASALLANGVTCFGRSLKYRRLRGVLSAGAEEPNALLTATLGMGTVPNLKATTLPLRPDLVLRSQNRWPTLRFDLASTLKLGRGFFGAGFYYKTFLWPSWHLYEGLIRRLAGLGDAPRHALAIGVSTEHLTCEVLIAGAGAAGLSAALAAARAGASVIVCERDPVCGGELEFEAGSLDGGRAGAWIADVLTELAQHGVRILTETTVINATDDLVIAHRDTAIRDGSCWIYKIRAGSYIDATGATERPIAFVDNDRPGTMLLGAAERFLSRYGARVGADLVLFANHNRVYDSAARFLAAGLKIAAIVDARPESAVRRAEVLAKRHDLERAGVLCLFEHVVVASVGGARVRGARIARIGSTDDGRVVCCDSILSSAGWSPVVHKDPSAANPGRYETDIAGFVGTGECDRTLAAGAADGRLELGEALESGHAAGERAARLARCEGSSGTAATAQNGDFTPDLVPFWRSNCSTPDEKSQFIDFQNDVTVADLRQALAEGFRDIEHIKRYTTLGMGTDQGRSTSASAAAIVAEMTGEPVAAIGLSRGRAPYHPVALRTLAQHRVGANLRGVRRTPMHRWHTAHEAVMEPMGLWLRPRYYRANDSDAFRAGVVEAARVRARGGITDASTLGKIVIGGPDAAAFLDRLYLNRASTLKIGRAKYMVNLREDGMVLDDGVVLRLAQDRFLATTSTSHAEHMLSHFEYYRETEWRGRSVAVSDVTDAWAVIVVAGPQSRETLREVLGAEWCPPIDRLAHLEFATGLWHDADLRVLRASFSGELAYELHCRHPIAVSLWERLIDAGLLPYGLEALDILRVEKGYLTGAEINGQTSPVDLNLHALIEQNNPCIGRELLSRPALQDPTRPCLVGVTPADKEGKVLAGAQIAHPRAPNRACGHVTSSVYSPTLSRWIGLALLDRSLAQPGSILLSRDPLRIGDTRIRVTAATHYDVSGERYKK